MAAVVQAELGGLDARLNDVIGTTLVDLDCRFATVRAKESNMGNFLADLVLEAVACDCVAYNSGTLRSDQVHHTGKLTMRDLLDILPYEDEFVVLEVDGMGRVGVGRGGSWCRVQGAGYRVQV